MAAGATLFSTLLVGSRTSRGFVPPYAAPWHKSSRGRRLGCTSSAVTSPTILVGETKVTKERPAEDGGAPLLDDGCELLDFSGSYPNVPEDPAEEVRDVLKGTAVYLLPVAGPTVAFITWQYILQGVHLVLGEEKSLLELTQMTLNPTTNGIVVASLATALGTLTSITVWTLRQRQLDVRSSINKEACDANLLKACLVAEFAPSYRPVPKAPKDTNPTLFFQVLVLLRQYVARVQVETSKRAEVKKLERQDVGDSELTGIMQAIHVEGVTTVLRQEVSNYITRLNDARSVRLATLSTAFPIIHWIILALLASSIAVCFLIEVDQSEGRFLSERPEDSLRLRLIFTILVGTFSGLTALCADLVDPYRGSFNITGCTTQLVTTLAQIDAELDRALASLSHCFTREEVTRAFKAAEKSGDGTFDYKEFSRWLQDRSPPIRPE